MIVTVSNLTESQIINVIERANEISLEKMGQERPIIMFPVNYGEEITGALWVSEPEDEDYGHHFGNISQELASVDEELFQLTIGNHHYPRLVDYVLEALSEGVQN